jgi:hypothetical protein
VANANAHPVSGNTTCHTAVNRANQRPPFHPLFSPAHISYGPVLLIKLTRPAPPSPAKARQGAICMQPQPTKLAPPPPPSRLRQSPCLSRPAPLIATAVVLFPLRGRAVVRTCRLQFRLFRLFCLSTACCCSSIFLCRSFRVASACVLLHPLSLAGCPVSPGSAGSSCSEPARACHCHLSAAAISRPTANVLPRRARPAPRPPGQGSRAGDIARHMPRAICHVFHIAYMLIICACGGEEAHAPC